MMPYQLIKQLAQVAPAIISRNAKPGAHCVIATAIGQMVLADAHVLSEAMAVQVVVCNHEWMVWGQDGWQGGVREQLRRGAYMMTNAPSWSGGSMPPPTTVSSPWDGHLVLRVPGVVHEAGHSVLVDLDFGSFNRPKHRIHVPSGLVMPLMGEAGVEGTLMEGGYQTHFAYSPLVAAYADDYLRAKDWVDRARYVEIVAEIRGAIQGLAERS